MSLISLISPFGVFQGPYEAPWSWNSKLWPPDAKNWLIGKDPDAWKDWRQEKGTTEDKMVGWHHWLNGHEFEQALGVGDGQGSLVCCSARGRKESVTSDWTELNWWSTLKLARGQRNFIKIDLGSFVKRTLKKKNLKIQQDHRSLWNLAKVIIKDFKGKYRLLKR